MPINKVSDTRNSVQGIPLWMISEFPVCKGKGNETVVMTYEEIEREGREIGTLPEGQWFAMITTKAGVMDELEIVTGWVEHQGVGASCLRLSRSEDNAFWVAMETKVMVIPNPFPDVDWSNEDDVAEDEIEESESN